MLEVATREWQDILEEASREHDPAKVEKLREELELALEERARRMRAQSTSTSQEKSA